MTTLDLTGKLDRPALRAPAPDEHGMLLGPGVRRRRERERRARRSRRSRSARAVLGHRGYLREVSPDGRLPLLYDYDHVDPAPLARMSGRLTRYGDVAPLLRDDDDQLCLVGPGDEVRLEFDAGRSPLARGWTRSFILRSVGYCKDADPFTAASDTVGPLPWRGMPAFPFGPEGETAGRPGLSGVPPHLPDPHGGGRALWTRREAHGSQVVSVCATDDGLRPDRELQCGHDTREVGRQYQYGPRPSAL